MPIIPVDRVVVKKTIFGKMELKKACCIKQIFSYKCPGGVAQWTSHLPQEQEDPGSNPARV
jgi:hypothetical protein